MSDYKSRPIFGLIKKLEDTQIQREAIAFIQFSGVKSIGDLVDKYSVQQLRLQEVSDSVIDGFQTVLKSDYGVSLDLVVRTAQPQASSTVYATKVASSIKRGYLVEDKGEALLVNDVTITLPKRGRKIPKEKLLEMYKAHSEGKDPKDIAQETGIGLQTIDSYLKRAHVIPGAEPAAPYVSKPARGASPDSPYSNLPMRTG